MKKLTIACIALLDWSGHAQVTAQQALNRAASYQSLDNRSLAIVTAYSAAYLVGFSALTPAQVLANAASYQGLDDHSLQVVTAYSIANTTNGGSQTPWTSDIDGGGFALTNAGSLTVSGGTLNSFTATSNYFSGNVRVDGVLSTATNAAFTIDFSKRHWSTNISANFTMAAPIGLDAAKQTLQTGVMDITADGSDRTITPPANTRLVWFGTNATTFHVTNAVQGFYAAINGRYTNLYVECGR